MEHQVLYRKYRPVISHSLPNAHSLKPLGFNISATGNYRFPTPSQFKPRHKKLFETE